VSRRRRAAALGLALLVEALLVLVLMLAGSGRFSPPGSEERPLSTFDVAAPTLSPETPREARQAAPQVAAEQAPAAEPSIPRPTPPVPRAAEVPAPAVKLPSLVELPADVMGASDLRSLPAPPASKPRGPSGPPAPRGQADSVLVEGSGPNGERLYAASWYREPYDSELRGYLSTAQPGWALIACRTVEEYRVEDCVAVDEWPSGSKLARAVLAAAWQFKVRPPRVGGQVQVGEWVRIRIDYGIKRERSWR
jgi:protein TonB